jgi:hypothetical protein
LHYFLGYRMATWGLGAVANDFHLLQQHKPRTKRGGMLEAVYISTH